LVTPPPERPSRLHLLPWRLPDDLVNAWRSLPWIRNNPSHRPQPCGQRADKCALEKVDLTPALLANSLRNTHLQPSDSGEDLAPLNGVPIFSPRRECTGVWLCHRLTLLSPFSRRFCLFSCRERPVGRGLTFVPGDVETRIRLITRRPSLFPTSQARTSIGSPCGSRSLTGEIRGFHVSLLKFVGLGTCCRPGSVLTTRWQR
jgi:hypothetical protein